MTPFQAATHAGLSPISRLLLQVLDRKSRDHNECWHSNATLSGLLKCCERTIRNALRALQYAGLIEIMRDYGLRSRRRIVLLWKRSFDTSVAANVDVQVAANMCSEIVPPPNNPPVEVPEGNTKEESGGDPSAACTPPLEASSPPPPVSFDPPSEPKTEPASEPAQTPAKATPEQVEALVTLAKEVFPAQPRRWVLGLAKRWRLSWTRAALARAKAKGGVKTGYVIRTLEGFKVEGGPPAELADPEAEAKRRAESRREIEELFSEEAIEKLCGILSL